MPPRRKTVLAARKLRRAMTPPEVWLWQHLRERPGGFRFRRQHSLGSYVLDFYCPSARLVIEVDGAVHGMGEKPERDMRRDTWLEAQGLRVLRIPAEEVLRNLDGVIRHIVGACGAPLHPSVAPSGPPPHAAHEED